MERLWTPWRMTYVGGEKRPGCVFCLVLQEDDDRESLIVHRGERAFIVLNLFPYNSGHSMVVPYAHAASIEDIDAPTRAEMFELANLAVEASRTVLRCDGFNLGMNLGEVAGAGVAEHIHLHVVPRWIGDANFMPILGNTMVMPELIPATYARLRGEIEAVLARRAGEIAQAGALAVIPSTGEVLLRRGRNGNVTLPKGHIEQGESVAHAALRVLEEDTGFRGTIVGWAGSTRFVDHDTPKTEQGRHVSYLLVTTEPTPAASAPVNVDTIPVPIDAAAKAIDIPGLAAMVATNVPVLRGLSEGNES